MIIKLGPSTSIKNCDYREDCVVLEQMSAEDGKHHEIIVDRDELLKSLLKLMQPGEAYARYAPPAPGDPIIPTYEDLPYAKCMLCGADYITSPTLPACPHCFPKK